MKRDIPFVCKAFNFNDMYGLCNGCMGFISGIDECNKLTGPCSP